MTRSKALGACLLLLVLVVFAMATGIAGKVVDTVASMISGSVQVEAYLHVRRKPVPLIGPNSDLETDREYEMYKQTQANLIKSPFVMNVALRKPGITSLSMLRARENPVEWLTEEISCMESPESQLIKVSMTGKVQGEVIKLVDAVVEAYMEEFVAEERRDTLKRLYIVEREYMNQLAEIRAKEEEYVNLTEQLGNSDSKRGSLRKELEMRELSRLERRIDSLDEMLVDLKSRLRIRQEMDRVAKAEPDELSERSLQSLPVEIKVLGEALQERRKAYEEQKNRMLEMESASADSIFLQDEIDRMKRSADEIKTVIDRLRINVKLLDRVKLIQPAFAVQ